MIGFEAIVTTESNKPIARWLANWDLPNEIDKLIEFGHAEIVKKTGGYPDTYKISVDGFMSWVEDVDRMRFLYPADVNTKGVNIGNLVDNGEQMLTLTLWDQS